MNIAKRTQQYFEHFSNQDIDLLSEMFADDITLKDWSVSVSGKSQVLDVIRGIYSQVEQIAVVVNLMVYCGDRVMSEIEINIDGDTIEAVDVIEYKDGKISAIRAYKN